jgi:periplasmic protein CpxP/Spy
VTSKGFSRPPVEVKRSRGIMPDDTFCRKYARLAETIRMLHAPEHWRLGMKRLTIASIPGALLLTGLTAAAFAQGSPQGSAQGTPSTQPPPASAPAPVAPAAPAVPPAHARASTPHGDPAHVDGRIEAMRRQLQITAQQAQAWDAFAQTMRDNAAATAQAYQDRAAHLQTMTAVENLHSFAQLEQARAQGLEVLATSFDALYGQLSDSQKHIADAMFAHQGERAAGHKQHQ